MDTLRRAGLPLSNTGSAPEASEHAEIQRLKGGDDQRYYGSSRGIFFYYLRIQSKDLFNQEYKKLFLHLFGNNRGLEFLGGNYH